MSIEANPAAGASSQNAVELLRVDHRRIANLIADCERLSAPAADGSAGSDADRAGLVARLGAVLRAHAQVEEELFYPALAAAVEVRDDARGDHAEIAARLQELAELPGDDVDGYARGCAALAMAVRDHVAHEEAELFPAAQGIDLEELGARMAVRRAELLGEQGVD